MPITMTEDQYAAAMLQDARKMASLRPSSVNNGLTARIRLELDGPTTVRDLAKRLGAGEDNVRGRLKALKAQGEARSEKVGNKVTWFPA